MRFCPWYRLDDAAAHAPAGPSVLQLRLASGLRDYPRGKSAMVHYQRADDARAAAAALAERFRGQDLLCRHLERDEADGAAADGGPPADQMAATYDKLAAEFLRRFGALPAPGAPEPTAAARRPDEDEA